MVQKALRKFLYLSVFLALQLQGQDQYATIDLSDSWVDSLSSIEYGEADLDKVVFQAYAGTLTSFKVQLVQGYSSSMHLQLSIDISGVTYEIELDNGQLLDESSSIIYSGTIADSDEIYFSVGGDQLYYYHNTTLLQQKSIIPDNDLKATVESYLDLAAVIYFYQEGGGVAETGDFAGFIHKPDTSPINQCSPDYNYVGIPNINISIENLSTLSYSLVTSNSVGEYTAALSPGMLRIIPSRNFHDYTLNALTAFDALLIQLHAQQLDILECPIKRIASDTNFDGQIDTTDANLVSDLILGNEDTLNGPIWRFIPKAYTYPSTGHPDYNFVNEFWNSAYANAQGNQYPFAANLNFNGKTYYYGGSNSWMEKVDEWPFGSEEACGETNWGFYTIKVGDVNDNLDLGSIQNFAGGGEESMRVIYTTNESSASAGINSRSAGRYRIRLIAKSVQPIQCYQLGLKVSTRSLEIIGLTPERDRMQQTERRNFGTRRGQLSEGVIKHIWWPDPERSNPDFQSQRGQMLFEFEVQTRESLELTSANLSNYIYFDSDILPTLFYTNGRVSREIEFEIEVEAL